MVTSCTLPPSTSASSCEKLISLPRTWTPGLWNRLNRATSKRPMKTQMAKLRKFEFMTTLVEPHFKRPRHRYPRHLAPAGGTSLTYRISLHRWERTHFQVKLALEVHASSTAFLKCGA